jgi:hypothetical protein
MRGQTLPLWLANIIITCVFACAIGSYGNIITYQFRAQAVADSAANAAVAVQAQEFNQMIEGLYAAGVEEYRIRHLLESIRVASMYSGGCYVTGTPCYVVFPKLVNAYRSSLYKYDRDARFINDVTATMDQSQLKLDVNKLLNQIAEACQNPTSNSLSTHFNCGATSRSTFKVFRTNIAPRLNLKAATADGQSNLLPSYSSTGPSNFNPQFFAPIAVEVRVCAVVPPLFPQLFGNLRKPSIVVARAAATDAMVEQDWMEPGITTNPFTGLPFQPKESYGDPGVDGFNWYAVDFGGNAARTSYMSSDPSNSHTAETINNEEFSARTGWWGPVPIMPFTNISDPKALEAGCS